MDPTSPEETRLEQRHGETDGVDEAQAEETGAAGERGGPADDNRAPRIPRELPILPVRNVVVFPGTVMPLSIGREKSKRLIDAVLAGDKMLAVFTQRHEETEDPGIDDIYRVGTAAQVLKLLRLPDGSSSLLVHGLQRVGVERYVATEPYWRAIINAHHDRVPSSLELEALAYTARRTAEQVIELSPNVPDEAKQILASIEKPGALADFLAANLSLGVVQKQELLETFDIMDRLRKINATLQNQLEVLELSRKIQDDVREQIDKTQREYFLNEQLKAIQRELGEGDARTSELADLRQRIDAAAMPEPVLKEANRELERLGRIPQVSPESGVIRDYLEWLIDMPWNKATTDNLDLNRAQEVLDNDHYGLEKVKRRIVEALAVRKLRPTGRSPILCFAGPPGVGKTSLGQSIARALGRKFIRIALGGVRDEADIRGHRRTYIGAIPGRLVQEIRKAGVNNPVIMLDELDKLGADFRGDPAAALLEVLDPEQNHSFTDHYLGVPFDLSHAMFIGTANYMEPVAPALKDRMEVIDLPGYTTQEKLEIAKRYLVPRQREHNGLGDRSITIDDAALLTLIEGHTREAGVRNLERHIGSIFRGLAAKVARDLPAPDMIRVKDLAEYLGPPRFEREQAMRVGMPGVVTGLAYTPVGGEIIFVEATLMPGRGVLTVTGQMGEVMRESTQAALAIVRARADHWGIPRKTLAESDIHVHVPAAAVPKDGPSAGVAMLAALYSLLKNVTADPTVALTGEITLRGLVLPVGGIKEKVLAAHRAGIRSVILPARNEADLHEVPPEVRQALHFVPVTNIEEVLSTAIPGYRAPDAPRGKTAAGRRAARARAPASQRAAGGKRRVSRAR
ncbi:MAG: endopeptidase La [Phycisphaerae bacterium]|nr:endopeptidase La [Phycisphaerae bacterium]MCZ2398959.1 endopeptidase La [Phycisphaerae bacterium]